MATHKPIRHGWHGLAAALLGGPALLAVLADAHAQTNAPSPSPAAREAPAVMSTEQATAELSQFSTFLRDYHHALAVGDRQFLEAHTLFPLSFAKAVYDMEAKARSGKLASIDALLRARHVLRWPLALVPKGPEDLARLRRGREKCGDARAPEVPDWKQGNPALELHGDEATLTYLAAPCESETHVVTLTFIRTEKTWRLRERTVRMGTE